MTVRLSDLANDDLIVYDGDIINKREAISLIKRGLLEPMFTLKGYVQIDIDYEEEH
ncbi:hypothetical protein ABNC92_10575 [Paenibacillus larvae]|uniref:Uncharacterized protein n=1 Tax=Paenibacillus phage Tripp TaxID=1718161 RepID=A0A0N9RTP7_9CAUD|nr:hypothetical protein [Paenibacillus larvae]YP_009210610.1 hypothetical protein TRIPP_90 [Paenibacillus phage Tripp]ALH46463.1 hypothetical protein TRIPP_90 [Paenibacillus phage Tripp]ETK27975.1 hypothetical protein ERIC1_1c14300 [Paenibacillus larvae subsp. larvae DSM 25719]MDT2293948.1 hypothetical protein [Paenibacillus larvae]